MSDALWLQPQWPGLSKEKHNPELWQATGDTSLERDTDSLIVVQMFSETRLFEDSWLNIFGNKVVIKIMGLSNFMPS